MQETRTSASGTRTTVYLHPDKANGLSYERETADTGVISHRHYFSAMGQAVAVLTTTQSGTNAQANPRWSYWHRDHLGSVAAVTDANGAVQERYAYDPFGKRRFTDGRLDANGTLVADHPDGAELAAGTKLHDTDRGFTGHEHLDDVGIVNMNGRIYDPLLARFMQPDPKLQELHNLQNFNRYSYVLNNPLRYTDPTGETVELAVYYFLTAVAATVASQAITSPELRAVVSIAAMVMIGPGANFFTGVGGHAMANAAVAGFASGMISSGGDPEATFKSMATAVLFAGVGQATGTAGGPTQVAAHAAAGCVSSVAQGGKCGHGAVSQAISKAFTVNTETWDPVPHAIGSVAAGGLASKMTGGSFEGGAKTAAYGYLFNCFAHGCNLKSEGYSHTAYRDGTVCNGPRSAECGFPGVHVEDSETQLSANIGGTYMKGFVGESSYVGRAIDTAGNSCTLTTSCSLYGLGAGGMGEVNLQLSGGRVGDGWSIQVFGALAVPIGGGELALGYGSSGEVLSFSRARGLFGGAGFQMCVQSCSGAK